MIRLHNSVTDSNEDVSHKSALNSCETWGSQYSNSKPQFLGEFWGYRISKYEDYGLLECDAV